LLNGTNDFTGTNHFAGVVIATNINNQITGSFTGNGGGLTNLATTNLVGAVADDHLSTNVAFLNGTNDFNGTNRFEGVVIATNINNLITGSFTGNGSGLTSLSGSQITGTISVAQLPASVVTNGGNVTLSGTFSGNGGGLTNLSTTNLVGTVEDDQLSTNVALLDGTNGFSGTNQFAGVVIATNGNNQITGNFTGNGGGLTNLSSGSLTTQLFTWLGPTNAFGVTNNSYWVYDATTNILITNILGAVPGQVNFGTLEISNASAFTLTSTFTGIGLSHGLITSNPIVIPSGKEAIWEFWTVGTIKTNYMNTP